MSNWMQKLQDFQAENRMRRQEEIDTAIFESTNENIFKSTSALLEANVEKGIIKNLLIKYWDLRPSEADFFIEKAAS